MSLLTVLILKYLNPTFPFCNVSTPCIWWLCCLFPPRYQLVPINGRSMRCPWESKWLRWHSLERSRGPPGQGNCAQRTSQKTCQVFHDIVDTTQTRVKFQESSIMGQHSTPFPKDTVNSIYWRLLLCLKHFFNRKFRTLEENLHVIYFMAELEKNRGRSVYLNMALSPEHSREGPFLSAQGVDAQGRGGTSSRWICCKPGTLPVLELNSGDNRLWGNQP